MLITPTHVGKAGPSDLRSLAQTIWKPQNLLMINYNSQNPWIISKRMGVVNHLGFMGGALPPQTVPLSLNLGSWEKEVWD